MNIKDNTKHAKHRRYIPQSFTPLSAAFFGCFVYKYIFFSLNITRFQSVHAHLAESQEKSYAPLPLPPPKKRRDQGSLFLTPDMDKIF